MKSAKILGLSLAIALGMGTMTLAKDADTGTPSQKEKDDGDKAHEQHLAGKVVSVAGSSITIESGHGDKAKQVTVETDDKTKFKVNGKDATLADIKAGMRIKAEPATGVATRVMASDNNKDGEKHKDGDEKHKDGGEKHKDGDEKHKDGGEKHKDGGEKHEHHDKPTKP